MLDALAATCLELAMSATPDGFVVIVIVTDPLGKHVAVESSRELQYTLQVLRCAADLRGIQ